MSATAVKVVGKTKGGKEIGYRMPEGKNLYEITFKTGGEIPEELKGGWNDIRQLTNKINNYITNSTSKKKNA